jgi:hypothetical protein
MEVPILLNDEGLVASLKEVADSVVAAIEPACVGRVEVCHDPRKGLRASPHREMDVVGHQAVGDQTKVELFPNAGEAGKVLFSILVISEDGLPLVPPGRYVVQRARELQPRWSRHSSPQLYVVASVEAPRRCRAGEIR